VQIDVLCSSAFPAGERGDRFSGKKMRRCSCNGQMFPNQEIGRSFSSTTAVLQIMKGSGIQEKRPPGLEADAIPTATSKQSASQHLSIRRSRCHRLGSSDVWYFFEIEIPEPLVSMLWNKQIKRRQKRFRRDPPLQCYRIATTRLLLKKLSIIDLSIYGPMSSRASGVERQWPCFSLTVK
jgi:hypothetical protein